MADGRRGEVDPERLWATMLAVHSLQSLPFSWLADDEGRITIVDKGMRFAAAQAEVLWGAEDARLGAAAAEAAAATVAAATAVPGRRRVAGLISNVLSQGQARADSTHSSAGPLLSARCCPLSAHCALLSARSS